MMAIPGLFKLYLKRAGLPSAQIKVDFFAEGTFNKLVIITSEDEDHVSNYECLLRIPLSVCPYYKD
jgi:hypothetical protein